MNLSSLMKTMNLHRKSCSRETKGKREKRKKVKKNRKK